ncbi:swr1-complex 4 [Gossypium arboreum]|uniref:Swr1-complex 4 n=1 Tax=Gossypium arboreum TaxID=29729 RepID=A0A0B0PVY2_GOSAR|nr:swr1-complex 4 [Gossypium arboreum]
MPMPCPRYGLTLALTYPCQYNVPDMVYTDTSRSQCMSQICLTQAYISRPMHVPDMSYTSSRLNANAISQIWSYTDSHNMADACPRHVLHWHINNPNVMA